MGWEAVWQLALKQYGAETVEMRILILLLAAFLVLMVLIGLKHAFRSAEPRPSPAPIPTAPKPQPVRVKMPMRRATRKCAKRTIRRQMAPRPSIRRAQLPSPS